MLKTSIVAGCMTAAANASSQAFEADTTHEDALMGYAHHEHEPVQEEERACVIGNSVKCYRYADEEAVQDAHAHSHAHTHAPAEEEEGEYYDEEGEYYDEEVEEQYYAEEEEEEDQYYAEEEEEPVQQSYHYPMRKWTPAPKRPEPQPRYRPEPEQPKRKQHHYRPQPEPKGRGGFRYG